MKRTLLFLASSLCLQLPVFAQEAEPTASLAITPLVTLDNPVRNFKKNYNYDWGGGLKLNYNVNSFEGKLGMDIGVQWYLDRFGVKNQKDVANMNSLTLNMDFYMFYVVTGMSLGTSRFKVGDNTFTNFGGNTGTELQGENKRWQFTYSRYFGLRIPAGKWVAIDCEYQLVSTERAWMFWHSLISGVLEEIPIAVCDNISSELLKKDKIAAAIIVKLLGTGISYAWYNFDYEHHNAPFNDAKPMRYHRVCLGTTILFGLKSQ